MSILAIFTDVFEDVTKQGRKIPTSDYHESGAYPIIDQGQNTIAGYTDETEGLFTDVPAIIFGDHTRVVKYVDTPCFLGADGVKLLKSKDSNANHKYLYHVLVNAKIPNTGYNRHFKWLKEVNIPLPTEVEQQRIVEVLDRLDSLIVLRKEQLAMLDELVKARFVEMFGDITDYVPVSYYINALTAGKSLAGEEECENKVLKTGAATYDEFDASQIKNLPVDYTPSQEHLIKDGDIIISRMNTAELVGATAFVWKAPENTYLPDRLWRAELKPHVNAIFVWQMLIQPSSKEQIRKAASGTSGSMKNISKPGLLGLEVKRVEFPQQNQFATFVEQTNKTKLTIQASLDKLEVMKKALMQEYFS